VMQNDEVLEVSVPTLFEYYEKTREFLDYLDNKFF